MLAFHFCLTDVLVLQSADTDSLFVAELYKQLIRFYQHYLQLTYHLRGLCKSD